MLSLWKSEVTQKIITSVIPLKDVHTKLTFIAGFKQTGIWPPDSDALRDYLFAVNNQSESSGSVQFSCGQVQFVSSSLKHFFHCKYMYMYTCTDLTHIDSLSVFYSS